MDNKPKTAGNVESMTIDATLMDSIVENLPTAQESSYSKELDDSIEGLKVLSPIEKEVAMEVVNGLSLKSIGVMLDLDLVTVKMIRNRKHVRKFVREYLDDVSTKRKENREEIIAQIIEARVNNLGEGEDMSSLSNKDTLDLILALDNIQKEKEKAQLGTKDNQVVNILNLIKKD